MALARDLGPRVVVKVLSRDVGHKSDVGGGERLLEAEINPLFVLAEGDGVLAADGLVVLQPARVAARRAPSASRGTLPSQ